MISKKTKFKRILKKVWHFVWEDNSVWPWIVNIVLAFLIVYFVIYPGLGLLFGTSLPVVAVVSGSMEHNKLGFDDFYQGQRSFYESNNIKKEDFEQFPFKNGFKKGDIVGIVQDFEKMIYGKDLLGRAVFRIPYLGWVKIGFTSIIRR